MTPSVLFAIRSDTSEFIPLAVALSAALAYKRRYVLWRDYARAHCVVKVMVYVCDAVAQPHDGRLARVVGAAVGVVQDTHARLVAQVQPAPVALEHVHHAQALLIVLEAAGIYAVERPLTRVAERRVS